MAVIVFIFALPSIRDQISYILKENCLVPYQERICGVKQFQLQSLENG